MTRRPPAEPARRLRPREQRCARCGSVDGIDFLVPPRVWKAVAGPEWTNEHYDSVLCFRCFDQLAYEKGVDYVRHLKHFYFVGDKSVIEFKLPATALERPNWRKVKLRRPRPRRGKR